LYYPTINVINLNPREIAPYDHNAHSFQADRWTDRQTGGRTDIMTIAQRFRDSFYFYKTIMTGSVDRETCLLMYEAVWTFDKAYTSERHAARQSEMPWRL